MADYSGLVASALRSIGNAGLTVSFSRKSAAQAYDPVAGEFTGAAIADQTWDASAVVLPATIQRFRGLDNKLADDNALVLAKARYLLVAADGKPEPQPEDRVAFFSETWRVVGCTPIAPDGTAIVYQVGVILLT